MMRSVNEVEVLARKAALGAGFPPAQAESFGRAAAHHLALEGDPEALTRALDAAGGPILRLHLLPEDIRRALPLAGPDMVLSLQPGDAALAPAYARLCGHAIAGCHVVEEAGIPRLHLSIAPDALASSLPARLTLQGDVYDALAASAARTLVPASDASRSGAGAGDIDND